MFLYGLYNVPWSLTGYDLRVCIPRVAYEHCLFNKEPILSLEQFIIKDKGSTYLYIQNLKKGRWPEVESRIIDNAEYAY